MRPACAQPEARVDVERLTSLDRLEAIAADWRALLVRAQAATPFQRPEWLLPWYRVFAPREVHALAVRDGAGCLIALVPAVLAESHLVLAGGGVSDYRAPIVDTGAAAGAIPAMRAALDRDATPCVFDDVPGDSPWLPLLDEDPCWRAEPACVCPVVPLPRTRAEWRDRLPGGLDRNIRRYGRRLDDEASGRYETVLDAAAASSGLDALFRMHSLRWHERGEAGVLQSADVRRFHDLSAPLLFDAGVLRLHLLYAGGEVIAAQYILVGAGRAYSYIGGFDPEWGRYGPGTLLMAHSIACAIEEGCTEFDLLRGVEPYKYAWGAVNRTSVRLIRREDADAR